MGLLLQRLLRILPRLLFGGLLPTGVLHWGQGVREGWH
jgi:hypothetical protein